MLLGLRTETMFQLDCSITDEDLAMIPKDLRKLYVFNTILNTFLKNILDSKNSF